MLETIVFLVIGATLGFAAGVFFQKSKKTNDQQTPSDLEKDRLTAELEQLRQEKVQLTEEKAKLSGRLEKSLEVFEQQKTELAEATGQVNRLHGNVNKLQADNEHLESRLAEQKQELEKMGERFKSEFQNLASEILKKNTREFSESNHKQIGEILSPLREKIESFEKRVNTVYNDENKSRSQLMGQVNQLMELNKRISEEANNLTNALKGDTKKQGAWGEFILEKILESSGLEKGLEYETQVSSKTDDGIFRPDVVVNLPDDKCVIIDSKVSLVAYEAYVNAEDSEDAARYLQQHIASLRTHVKGLSSKEYQSKTKGQSLDFVLMFVPIEAGFSEALKNDHDLYNFAWSNRIVIVSPTTLLATLRTIASVWKQEKQNRNVIEIAEESGKLYDKFVLFLQDFKKIETGLKQTNNAYEGALNKLQTGTGNLIRRAEKIKTLGAKTSKAIDQNLIDQSQE